MNDSIPDELRDNLRKLDASPKPRNAKVTTVHNAYLDFSVYEREKTGSDVIVFSMGRRQGKTTALTSLAAAYLATGLREKSTAGRQVAVYTTSKRCAEHFLQEVEETMEQVYPEAGEVSRKSGEFVEYKSAKGTMTMYVYDAKPETLRERRQQLEKGLVILDNADYFGETIEWILCPTIARGGMTVVISIEGQRNVGPVLLARHVKKEEPVVAFLHIVSAAKK